MTSDYEVWWKELIEKLRELEREPDKVPPGKRQATKESLRRALDALLDK